MLSKGRRSMHRALRASSSVLTSTSCTQSRRSTPCLFQHSRLQANRALTFSATSIRRAPEKTVVDAEQLLSTLPPPWPHDPWLEIKSLVKEVGKVVVVLDDDPTGTQSVHDVPLLTSWSQSTLQEELKRLQQAFAPGVGSTGGGGGGGGSGGGGGQDRWAYRYPVLYLLTNARALRPARAEALYRSISANIAAASAATGVEVVLVSRSDSTLRGHFPLDLKAISQGIMDFNNRTASFASPFITPNPNPTATALPAHFDGWIVMPFFEAAGRLTVNNVHYVMVGSMNSNSSSGGGGGGGGDNPHRKGSQGPMLVPAAMTEYAQDKAFGFSRSNLRAWVEEKTHGEIPTKKVRTITLKDLRRGGPEYVRDSLMTVAKEEVVVVDAACQRDLDVFVAGLLHAELCGKMFLFRTAASFVGVRGGVDSQPLLDRADFAEFSTSSSSAAAAMGDDVDGPVVGKRVKGGLVVFGSYVSKSTGQLESVLNETDAVAVEVQLLDKVLGLGTEGLDEDKASRVRAKYVRRLTEKVEEALREDRDVVVYTSRAVRQEDGNGGLSIGATVSDMLVSIVKGLTVIPSFLIAKGGITSNDIATKALHIKKAMVAGQILPGVPVWSTGDDCKYPGIKYVVFPGNVGGKTAVTEVMRKLGTPNKGVKRTNASGDDDMVHKPRTKGPLSGSSTSGVYGDGGSGGSGSGGGGGGGGKTLHMVQQASKEGVAVGAFNVYNLEGALAVAAASKTTGRPAILQVHPAVLRFGGTALLGALQALSRESNERGHPPLSVHIDHATPQEEEQLVRVVVLGLVDSIMVDGSALPFEDNVRWTSKMAKYAHDRGLAVEAELGRLAGEEDGLSVEEVHAKMTDPAQVPDFLDRTRVDLLACTIGNVHGKYAKPPQLDFNRLRQIRACSGTTPLVLHGASGLPTDQVHLAVKHGICKFNVNTEMRQAYMGAIASMMQQETGTGVEVDVLTVMEESTKGMRDIAISKMRLFALR